MKLWLKYVSKMNNKMIFENICKLVHSNPDHPQHTVAQTEKKKTLFAFFPEHIKIVFFVSSLWNLPDLLFFSPPLPHSVCLHLSLSPHWCVSTAHSSTIWRCVCVCVRVTGALTLAVGHCQRQQVLHRFSSQTNQLSQADLLIWSTISIHILNIVFSDVVQHFRSKRLRS